MKILYLKSISSTQKYLKKLILKDDFISSLAIVANNQTDGVGSRDNQWIGLSGNLFLSFSLLVKELPKDLKLESASIYFAEILRETLSELGSKVWLKWPNDLYINDKKVGGIITNIVNNHIICGVGLNLILSPKESTILDIKIEKEMLVDIYIKKIENLFTWKQIFSKYKLNFYINQKFYTHYKSLIISLDEAELQDDGSIVVEGERIYSLR